MRNRIRAIRQNDKGFTLIELLIVIVILGVLAGIVVFAVSAFNNDGVQTACKADIKNVEIASEAYFAKEGTYAADVDAMVDKGYLKEVPAGKYAITYTPGDATTTPPTLASVTGTFNGAAC